jgi:hypothetical protein
MKQLQKLAFLAAACALLIATFSIIGPRAVKAAVSTLVQVVNTPANPVPNADVNAPGEEPFQTALCLTVPGGSCPSLPFNFVVPATTSDGLTVKRLVIEQMNAACTITGTASHIQTYMPTLTNENQVNGEAYVGATYLPLSPSSPGNSSVLVSSLAARAYADPGTTVQPYLFGDFGVSSSLTCTYNVAGYFLTH